MLARSKRRKKMPDRETMCEFPSLAEIQRLLSIGWVLRWCPGLEVFELHRNDKSIEIRPCDIFQMTSGFNTGFYALLDDAHIMVHCLFSGHLKLVENMVIRTADKNTRFFQANFLNQFKILFKEAFWTYKKCSRIC